MLCIQSCIIVDRLTFSQFTMCTIPVLKLPLYISLPGGIPTVGRGQQLLRADERNGARHCRQASGDTQLSKAQGQRNIFSQ